jgi:hypothetical protein
MTIIYLINQSTSQLFNEVCISRQPFEICPSFFSNGADNTFNQQYLKFG